MQSLIWILQMPNMKDPKFYIMDSSEKVRKII